MGRRDLLKWVNRTVGVAYVRVEDVADGIAFAQLIDAAYPESRVPLYRLNFATRHEHDRSRNLEIVVATLDRMGLDVPIDVREVSRGTYRACDEALRWLFVIVNRELPPNAIQGYDGNARRAEAMEKRRFLARAPARSPGWMSFASWESRNAETASAATATHTFGSSQPAEFQKANMSLDDGVSYWYETFANTGTTRGFGKLDHERGDSGDDDEAARFQTPAVPTRDVKIGSQTLTPQRDDSKVFVSQRTNPRPATAPPARRTAPRGGHDYFTRFRLSVESVPSSPQTKYPLTKFSARVAIRPEVSQTPVPPVSVLRAKRFGDEIELLLTPEPGSSHRPASARQVPFRSLDRWASKARATNAARAEEVRANGVGIWETQRARSRFPGSPRNPRREVSWSDTSMSFRGSVTDRVPWSTRARHREHETQHLSGTHREKAKPAEKPFSTRNTKFWDDFFSGDEDSCSDSHEDSSSSSDEDWTSSPAGSAERASRLEKAERAARQKSERRFLFPSHSMPGGVSRRESERVSQSAQNLRFVLNLARAAETEMEASIEASRVNAIRFSDSRNAKLAQTSRASLKREVGEIKAREVERRRVKEEARQTRIEQEALRCAALEQAQRLEAELRKRKESDDAARVEKETYKAEVISARREVRLEEARAHRETRRKQVRRDLHIEAPGDRVDVDSSEDEKETGTGTDGGTGTETNNPKSLSSATKKKRADLQSLAEYLKWELAKELSQFTRDKEATDLVSKQRDHAVFTLGRVETKRRLARRDDDGDRF